MIAISILTKEQVPAANGLPSVWACWLELTDGQDTYYLPTTAPADTKDLAAHFQAQADVLWQIAVRKNYVYENLLQSVLANNRLAALEERVRDLEVRS